MTRRSASHPAVVLLALGEALPSLAGLGLESFAELPLSARPRGAAEDRSSKQHAVPATLH